MTKKKKSSREDQGPEREAALPESKKPASSVSVDDVPVATVTLHSLTHTLQLSLVIKNQPQYLNDC